MSLTFGSLFAGIGGMDLGLERAGMTCKWQVEIDGYCRQVLAKHWPDVKRYEDVRTVGAHNLEPVDLICGGFPCQDVSVAGKRAGLDGERSGLWFEFARIIRELRPRYALVENVPGLLADGMGRVLGELAEIGYDAEWDCIPAAAVGAPHLRDRVFIVAHTDSERRAWRWGAMERDAGNADESRARQGQAHDVADPKRNGRVARRTGDAAQGPRGRESDRSGEWATLADSDLPRLEGRGEHRHGAREWPAWSSGEPYTGDWSFEPRVGRVASGVPQRVDRLRGLGNAVVPQVAEAVGRMILEAS